MTSIKIGEAHTVQFPMVDHAVEIGWTPLTPEAALVRRGSAASMVFPGVLEAKLGDEAGGGLTEVVR